MNKRMSRLGVSIVALLLAGAGAILFAALRPGPTRAAALMSAITACRAVGTYGYSAFGYTYDDNLLGLPVGYVTSNGTLTMSPSGELTIKEYEVVNGQLVPAPPGTSQPFTFTGQATVNSDCTFSADLTMEGTTIPGFVGVIVDNGNQVRAMTVIPGIQVSYVSTVKVHPTTSGNNQQ
jgi:hypothetical protein